MSNTFGTRRCGNPNALVVEPQKIVHDQRKLALQLLGVRLLRTWRHATHHEVVWIVPVPYHIICKYRFPYNLDLPQHLNQVSHTK